MLEESTTRADRTIALFDCDSAIYRSGFSCESKQYYLWSGDTLIGVFPTLKQAGEASKDLDPENVEIRHEHNVEPVENALHNLKNIINRTVEKFPNAEWELYLTGKGNFRYDIAKTLPYKGNRLEMAKPVHYDALRTYAVRKFGAVVIDGHEADDEIAIRCTDIRAQGNTPIIVSIDKDLRQLGGLFYNWVKETLEDIPEIEAKRSYYTQILTGDRTDNIAGLDGIGPKTAEKMLKDCRTERDMVRVVRQAYKDHKVYDRLPEIGTLLWLQRTRELKTWTEPQV